VDSLSEESQVQTLLCDTRRTSRVLHWVALCCIVLHCVALCCSEKRVFPRVAQESLHLSLFAHPSLSHKRVSLLCDETLLCDTREDSLLTATQCNTMQHNATQCNTLQHSRRACVLGDGDNYIGPFCNNALQHATHCNTLQHTATHCNTLQHTATHCKTLQNTATHCNTLQHTRSRRIVPMAGPYCNTNCNARQHTAKYTAKHYSTLPHAAAHCNTLEHIATP